MNQSGPKWPFTVLFADASLDLRNCKNRNQGSRNSHFVSLPVLFLCPFLPKVGEVSSKYGCQCAERDNYGKTGIY